MVVHDITNTQILIFYKMNQTAMAREFSRILRIVALLASVVETAVGMGILIYFTKSTFFSLLLK